MSRTIWICLSLSLLLTGKRAWDNREAGEMKVWINYNDEQ